MNQQRLFESEYKNNFKTFLLMAIIFAIIGVLGYLISLKTGNFNIIYLFLIIGVIQNLIAYWFSGNIAIRFSGAIKVDLSKQEELRLQKIVERLSHLADLPTP